jgi:hypothetical protein
MVLDQFARLNKLLAKSIEGNDDRGIDVGLMSGFPVGTMRSHVDDLRNNSRIFSRDCPEYETEPIHAASDHAALFVDLNI